MSESKIITLKENFPIRFPYPVKKRKMIDVLQYIRMYQEELVIRRINQYTSSHFKNHSYISGALIEDITFDYIPNRNNSHLDKVPIKDKVFETYQAIDVEITLEIEILFHKSLNWVKLKDPQFYEDLSKRKFIKGMFNNIIFRSIIDSNVDDLF